MAYSEPPRAEQGARDGHLCVIDRQDAISVVDGQRNLGASQGWTASGAGEDDVIHLAAAQVLGPLLTHHPSEGIDDIGLSRAIGSDDGGDARFEGECGGRGKGLETLQGQALQIHATAPGSPEW